MRRTFLAVGFGVLVSMMLVPRAHWDAAQGWRSVEWWLPFFIDSPWGKTIHWQQFALQTVFLAIFAAVIVH